MFGLVHTEVSNNGKGYQVNLDEKKAVKMQGDLGRHGNSIIGYASYRISRDVKSH